MMAQSERIHTVVTLAKRARVRRGLRFFLTTSGRLLVAASGIALALVAADILVGLPIDWRAALIGLGASAIGLSAVLTLTRLGALLDGLREIDTALNLHDRLGSALDLSQRDGLDAFSDLATREGEEAAKGVKLREAIAIRLGNTWAAWPALAALAIAGGLFAPRYDLLGAQASEEVAFERESAQVRASEQLREAHDELQRELNAQPAQPESDRASEDALRTLDLLAQELESGGEDADAAREQASGALNEAARSFEERADRAEMKERATQDILSELARDQPAAGGNESGEAGETTPFDPAGALREQLAQNELDNASESLEEMRREIERLSPEEREELKRELEAIAQDLHDAAERTERDIAQDRERERSELGDWGVQDEDAQDLQNTPSEDEIREKLEDMGFDEEIARRSAKKIAEQERERRAREEAAKETKELSEDLDTAADELTKDPEAEPTPPNDPGEPKDTEKDAPQRDPGQKNDGDSAQDATPESKEQGGEERNPNDQERDGQEQQQSEQGAKEQNTKPTEQEGGEPKDSEQRKGTQRQGAETPEATPSENTTQKGSEKQGEASNQSQQNSQENAQQGDQRGAGEAQERGENRTGAQESGEQNTRQSDGAPGNPDGRGTGGGAQDETGGGQGGVERLRERLREMRESAQDADRLRGNASSMREQAQKMLEEMTPEQREKLARWMQSQQREQRTPGGFATDAVDARRPGESDRVAGEATNPNWQAERGEGTTSNRSLADELREAAKGNERALEERSVPAKYRNVEEYFRRAIERAENDAKPAAPPAESAKDAKPNK